MCKHLDEIFFVSISLLVTAGLLLSMSGFKIGLELSLVRFLQDGHEGHLENLESGTRSRTGTGIGKSKGKNVNSVK